MPLNIETDKRKYWINAFIHLIIFLTPASVWLQRSKWKGNVQRNGAEIPKLSQYETNCNKNDLIEFKRFHCFKQSRKTFKNDRKYNSLYYNVNKIQSDVAIFNNLLDTLSDIAYLQGNLINDMLLMHRLAAPNNENILITRLFSLPSHQFETNKQKKWYLLTKLPFITFIA